jgi:hypothetical protein
LIRGFGEHFLDADDLRIIRGHALDDFLGDKFADNGIRAVGDVADGIAFDVEER